MSMTQPKKRHRQVAMVFRTWGGKRKGAGRPAKGWRSSEPHRKRRQFAATTPLHVTLRVVEAVGTLRRRDAYHAVRKAMQTMLARTSFRIIHISLERDHVHLIVEAETSNALARGMQGFQISVARRLNATLAKSNVRRRGQVFLDRYHAVVLPSPTQARNAIGYTLSNWRKHGLDNDIDTQFWEVDYYSSGPSFRGWKEYQDTDEPFEIPDRYQLLPVAPPRSWLLGAGWKLAGELSLRSVPGPHRSSARSSARA